MCVFSSSSCVVSKLQHQCIKGLFFCFQILLCALILSSFVGYLFSYKIYCVLIFEFLCHLFLSCSYRTKMVKRVLRNKKKTTKMLRQSVAVNNLLSRSVFSQYSFTVAELFVGLKRMVVGQFCQPIP